MGLVKHALGDWGDRLVALAAKDYFFDDPLKRVYFENFTNLIPMDRTGSLRESLRLAARVIEDGYVLLIFPRERGRNRGLCSRSRRRLATWRCTIRSTCCRCTWKVHMTRCQRQRAAQARHSRRRTLGRCSALNS